MPHRNALKLDSEHNSAIRAEIGHRLRMLLSKEQHGVPSRIEHLLYSLSRLDAMRVL
jgi:hypothetical protein